MTPSKLQSKKHGFTRIKKWISADTNIRENL